MTFRPFRPEDVLPVAQVHLESWRSAYRGILSDAYLDGEAEAERRQHWHARFAAGDRHQFGRLAEHAGRTVGFAFVIRDDEPAPVNLLDNLHVVPDARGLGIGRLLLGAVADELHVRGWDGGLSLWVFEANVDARRFYERHGAHLVETDWRLTPDHRRVRGCRYAW
ncbi:MAG: GNAT family N-acetyltransferase, partial [Vicinamibacterales bacterium]